MRKTFCIGYNDVIDFFIFLFFLFFFIHAFSIDNMFKWNSKLQLLTCAIGGKTSFKHNMFILVCTGLGSIIRSYDFIFKQI